MKPESTNQTIRGSRRNLRTVKQDTLHQIALLLFAVPVKRKALQMIEELIAESRGELLSDISSEVEHSKSQQGTQEAKDDQQ